MQCTKCGYVMDPFEKECPKCLRVGVAAENLPPPLPEPTILKNPSLARRMAAPPPIERDPPELGWPLTIALWVFLVIYSLSFLLYLANGSILTINCAINIVATIGLLRCQKWGYYLLAFFSVGPIVFAMMFGAFKDPISWFIGACAVIILLFTLGKWDKLD